jgi:hypothetical protein
MHILRLTILLVLLTPLGALAQAGSSTDVLRGRVVGEDGAPVRGALVEAWSAQSGVRRATTSGADGVYTLLFPDGGGRFRLRVSHLGREPYEAQVARVADEEVLLHDVRLGTRPLDVEGVVAQGRRTLPPGRGEAGSQTRGIDGDLAGRLPLETTDPASLAALAPGVVPLAGADSLGGAGGFSIAGQRASQNQVTLDGATFASMLSGGALGGGLGLPQEGMRSTQVVTSTYDVARGQFSGGQVAMTTQGGTNTRQGSLSYRLGDDRLQGRAGQGDWTDGFRQNRFGGGLGGPLVRDRLFYNLSLAAQRREDGLFALAPRTDAGYAALGAQADSVARFLEILGRVHGVPLEGQAGAYDRRGDALSALARLDYHASERHSLSLRAFGTAFDMRRAFIRPLDAMENGGEMGSASSGAIGTVASRLGASGPGTASSWAPSSTVPGSSRRRRSRATGSSPSTRWRTWRRGGRAPSPARCWRGRRREAAGTPRSTSATRTDRSGRQGRWTGGTPSPASSASPSRGPGSYRWWRAPCPGRPSRRACRAT